MKSVNDHIKAKYSVLMVLTHEDERLVTELKKSFSTREVVQWTFSRGLDEKEANGEPVEKVLKHIAECKKPSIFVLRDYQMFLKLPGVCARLKDLWVALRDREVTVVITSARREVPVELEEVVTVLDYDLPDREYMADVVRGAAQAWKLENINAEQVADALAGLSEQQASDVLALSWVKTHNIDVETVLNEKARTVAQDGTLEMLRVGESLQDVAGYDELINWLLSRRRAFSEEARAFGLPVPKGILLVGVPGCITGDALVEINRVGKSPTGISRKIRLDDLATRFNGGRTSHQPILWDPQVRTRIRFRSDDGFVRLTNITDVWASGIKEVLRLTDERGVSIKATADHQFLTETGWKQLQHIVPGEKIWVDAGLTQEKRKGKKALYKYACGLRYHPHATSPNMKHKSRRYTVPLHRIVWEAHSNKMGLDAYIECCRRGPIAGLSFVDPSTHTVHHKDENPANNDVSNLELLEEREHRVRHATDEGWQNVTARTKLSAVVGIEAAGAEMTYDISVEGNPHCFLANGFVVHNCGKSLCAKAVSKSWGLPLIKCDIGSLFGGVIGASEANVRKMIRMAEAISPCVLFLDELEKGLSSSSGQSSGDSGTSARMLGTFLTWLQEKTKPVFVVASANKPEALPPELLRRGRWDEIWALDLPNQAGRASIFQVHLRKRGRDPAKFDLEGLAEATPSFTGAEIEAVVVEGLYQAFQDGARELENLDIFDAIDKTVPLAKAVGSEIDTMRSWAKGRARNAAGLENTVPDGNRFTRVG